MEFRIEKQNRFYLRINLQIWKYFLIQSQDSLFLALKNVKLIHQRSSADFREIVTKIKFFIRILMWVLFRAGDQWARREINAPWVR